MLSEPVPVDVLLPSLVPLPVRSKHMFLGPSLPRQVVLQQLDYLRQPLVIKDPKMSFINRYKMVDWYTANEPAPPGERSTFVTYPFFTRKKDLLPASLLGAVELILSE